MRAKIKKLQNRKFYPDSTSTNREDFLIIMLF